MISRRGFVGSVAGASAASTLLPVAALAASPRADAVAALDPLKTMIRMRGRSDGEIAITWIDAERSLAIGNVFHPLDRMIGLQLTRYRRDGETWFGKMFEVMYYCDSATGEQLETNLMPGASEPVAVPAYRVEPPESEYRQSLDRWFRPEPGSPAPSAHVQRYVQQPYLHGDKVMLRGGEYSRVYPDVEKPPTQFYREWLFWQADADAVLDPDIASVPTTFTYAGATALKPWMKLDGIEGHIVSNGIGAKEPTMDALPAPLIALLEKNEPRALADPESYVARRS